jgi:hypothetical protein
MRSLNNKLLSEITGTKDGRRRGYFLPEGVDTLNSNICSVFRAKIVFW